MNVFRRVFAVLLSSVLFLGMVTVNDSQVEAKGNVEVTAKYLKDGTVLVKAKNKSGSNVDIDFVVTCYDKNKSNLGTMKGEFNYMPNKAVWYESFYDWEVKEGTSNVKVDYTVNNNDSSYNMGYYKSIDSKKFSVEVVSNIQHSDEYFPYTETTVKVKNKTNKTVNGYAVILLYNKDTLVGSHMFDMNNVNAGGSKLDTITLGSIVSNGSGLINVTKAKLVQHSVYPK